MGVNIIKAIVRKMEFPADERIIAISDIHGNLKLFQMLLEKINYSEDDILILLGDLIEKGPNSLKTLRYIMELSARNRVYSLSGNCDTIWEDIKYEIDDENLLRYMVNRKNSILNEMCEELSIKVNPEADIKYIKDQLLKHYSEEFNWLEQLPHIIETQNFVFAHAGITTESLDEQDARQVMKNDGFMEQGLRFSKYVVVGHWPIVNYCKEKGFYNPIINKEQKIISIDGGNIIKKDGQLNALIINNNDAASICYDSIDELPKGIIIEDQSSRLNTIYISWADNAVEVLEENEEFSLCRHISSNHKLWIMNSQLLNTKYGVRCYDSTDYFLPVSKGEVVSIIDRNSKQTLVKKDGEVGWVLNEKLKCNS